MPAERKAKSRKSGVLSGVFNFVSREFEHFVANATGSSDSGPPIPDVFSDEEEDEEYEGEGHEITYEDFQCSDTRSPPRKRTRTRRRTPTPEARPYRRDLSERIVVSTKIRRRSSREENLAEDEPNSPRSPSPPLPPALKREPSVTMPGALFPRSPSMEPEGTVITEREQRVRFASKALDSPATHFSPRKSSSSSSSSLIPTGSSPPTTPRRRTHLDSSVKAAVDRFKDDADPSILLPNTKSSPHAVTRSTVDKGKGRAIDPDPIEDQSSMSRMQGKEQELVAALEDLDRNERRLESNDETSFLEGIKRDRDKDKERIRMLEEEIERLKQELMKRPSSVSELHLPPPPPPPPPPPKTILAIPKETSDHDSLFASARASLRHAPTPVENPINPLPSRRAGMPTVGIAPDKMAAFLKEMKTVRLRKVSEKSSFLGSDLSFLSAPSLSVADLSLRRSVSVHRSELSVPPSSTSSASANHSMSEIEGRIGEKRKRTVTGSQEELRAPLRRRSVASSAESSFATDSTLNNSSIHPTETSVAPSLSQSYPPPVRLMNPGSSWQSSSVTDAPTPSLCSDNDAERDETSPDDLPPSTPPVTSGPSRAFFRFKGNGIPIEPEKARRNSDTVMGDALRRTTRESTTQQDIRQPSNTNTKSSIFDKRPPTSPIPNKSPRRPRPPARGAQILPQSHSTPFNARHYSDDEDPLSLMFSSLDDGSRVSKPRRDRKKDDDRLQLSTNRETHSPPPPPMPSSSRSTSRTQLQSQAQAPRRSRSASQSSRSSRRLTLDEELHNVISRRDHDDKDDFNSGVFVGLGTRSKRRGFLTGGGAGGVPVFMGAGYVDGAIDDEQCSSGEDHEKQDRSRRSLSRSSRRDDDDEYLPRVRAYR